MPPKFKPAASAPARQTIKNAFEDLDRTITPVDSRDFSTTTLEHVRKAALEIENQLAARQSLRNMRRLVPLFEGLEHYSKVVDVLCNGTPYLPWIWAPITLILRVALEYVEAFEVIMKGYTKIAESLVRFEILDSTFKDSHAFQETLAVFYSDILQFHKFAYTFVRRSSWKLLFLTSWGRFQRRFDGIVESLERHGTLVDQEANARHIAESHRHIAESRQRWKEAQMWREEEQERLTTQENELAMKQLRYISLWLKADDSEQVTVQDLVSSEGIRYPGTCSWALKNQKLVAWLRKDTESCLCWLQGIPGSGKSVLMTQIQAFMRSDSRAVVCHFLNSSYATSTVYDQILRSLLLQLLRGDGDLTAHVYSKYVMGKKTTTISILEELIKTLFTATSHEPRKTQFRWILIDGFESCEPNKQASLISLVNQLISKNPQSGGTVCKVLISSRSSPMLSKRLGRKQIISLSEEKQALDVAITDYATLRLNSLRERFDQLHLDHHDLENIKLAIAKKADGMFLYARLILDYLGRKIFYSRAEVKKSIEDLPQELSDYYREILARIIAPLDVESVERVRSLFGWLAFAKRPLKRLELLSAITFGSSDYLAPHLVPEFILVVCGALVDERPDATLAFIHSTVNEFLQSSSSNLLLNQANSTNEHGIASITCLQAGMHFFLGNFTEHEINLRVVAGLHGFHLYAADHWVDDLLTAVATAATSISELPLYRLAVTLAERASGLANDTTLEEHQRECNDIDARLGLIPDFSVRELAKSAIESRSPKALELQVSFLSDTAGSSGVRAEAATWTPLQATVKAYQDTVRHLLEQADYPGVSSEELQRFKHQFRNSAFTCRLGGCPNTTLGFVSEAMRDEHELAHSKPIMCSFPDCRYPPFPSLRAMERHKTRIHLVRAVHRPIGRPERAKNSSTKVLRRQDKSIPAPDHHVPARTRPVSLDMDDYRSEPESENPNLGPSQGNPRSQSMLTSENRDNLLAVMMSDIRPDQQRIVLGLPIEKQNEVLVKWLSFQDQQQRKADQPQAQAQLGLHAQGNHKTQFNPEGNVTPQPVGNMPIGNVQNHAPMQQQTTPGDWVRMGFLPGELSQESNMNNEDWRRSAYYSHLYEPSSPWPDFVGAEVAEPSFSSYTSYHDDGNRFAPPLTFSSAAWQEGDDRRMQPPVAPSSGVANRSGSAGTGSGEENDPFLNLLEQLAESEKAQRHHNSLLY